MKYQIPELHLVGAAHNLVLGSQLDKVAENQINSDALDCEGPYAASTQPDCLGW